MPVYQGQDSCYARKEGFYVKRIRGPGGNPLREAVAIAKLILHDYQRGYTYEQRTCQRIRMNDELFEKRLRFLIYLSKIHGAPCEVVDAVRRLVRYVLRRKKLPKTIKVGDNKIEVGRLLRGMYARVKKTRTARKITERRRTRRR